MEIHPLSAGQAPLAALLTCDLLVEEGYELLPTAFSALRKEIETAILSGTSQVIVGMDGDIPIGMIQLKFDCDPIVGERVEVLRFYITPAYRRTRVAYQLLQETIRLNPHLQDSTPILISTSGDNPLRNSFKQLGFQPYLTIHSTKVETIRERMRT